MFNLKIRTKILILAFLPLAVVGYFAVLEIQNERDLMANAEKINELTEFSTTISAMVHELQKERGRTGLFTGSVGKTFEKELAEQRALTDEKRKNWEEFSRNFHPEKFGSEFSDKFAITVSKLRELDKHREGVSSLAFDSQQGIAFYTALNGLIIDNILEVSKINTSQEFVLLIEIYATFLRSKELVGVERATGSRIFSEDKFSEGDYNRFFKIIVLQDNYFAAFADSIDKDRAKFFNKITGELPFAKTKEMRDILLATSPDGGNFNVSSGDWFDFMTEKINLLKEVEDKIAGDLIEKSNNVKKRVQKDLTLFLATIFVIFALVLLSTLLLIKNFYRRLGSIVKMILEIVEKNNFNLRFSVEANDELGRIAGTFNNMLEKIEIIKQNLKEEEGRYIKLVSSIEKELRDKIKVFKKDKEERQETLKVKIADMEEKIKELETFKKLSFGRELRILELKKEVESLKRKSN